MEQFIEKLVDVLDTEEEITMETALDDLDEWDSLSKVSYIAMANASFGKKVTLDQLRACDTIADLYNLVK